MPMLFFIDYETSILTDRKDLETRNQVPYMAFRKQGDTAFRMECFHVEGQPRIVYEIDASRYAKGEIHSLRAYNSRLSELPEDRVSMSIFQDMWGIAAIREDMHALHHSRFPNDVLFYIPPGTEDMYIYSRNPSLFENVEPIVTDSNDFHAILRAHCPGYVDPRPLNTLRLKTMLKLDPNDSLACMESQLDFVTAILLALVESSPELKLAVLEKVGEYANFKDAVEKSLLFTVKDPGRCLEEIRTWKALARATQRDYYAARAALAGKEADNAADH